MRDKQRYYRPVLGLDQEGVQIAATLRPWKWLNVYGEYRDYDRHHSRANAAIRAPANLVLDTGERLDNQLTRYAVALGGTALTNGFLDFTNESSMLGVYTHHHYITKASSVTIEILPRALTGCRSRSINSASLRRRRR